MPGKAEVKEGKHHTGDAHLLSRMGGEATAASATALATVVAALAWGPPGSSTFYAGDVKAVVMKTYGHAFIKGLLIPVHGGEGVERVPDDDMPLVRRQLVAYTTGYCIFKCVMRLLRERVHAP